MRELFLQYRIRKFTVMVILFLNVSVTHRSLSQVPPNSEMPNQLLKSVQFDTSRLLSDRPLKSPWGAVLRSAVLPGWGQIYTQQYVKAGIAFSLDTFLAYQIFKYDNRWQDTGNRDFRNKRNLYTWYFSLAYLLTMVDAYVDAYLYKFEEAMEISHRIKVEEGKWAAELRFSFHF